MSDDMETPHVPTSVSFETDKRRIFGLRDDEIAVKFTKVYAPDHTEHNVIRMTRDELADAFYEIADYLGIETC